MEKFIYITIAKFDYEGYDVLKAFKTEKAAQRHCDGIEEYEKGKRECPELDESDKVWDKFYKWQEAFRKDHPAGAVGCNADEYGVIKVEMSGA